MARVTIQLLRNQYWDQPREVSIETLALCNARCTFCPYGSLGREREKLSMDLITYLVGQMKSWRQPFFISPFKVNEPLLDPRMEDVCRRIDQEIPMARIRFFTNGSVLTLDHLTWLHKIRHLEELWISLNSCDPAEYKELMGLKFSVTEMHLNRLHAWVKLGHFRCPVRVSRVAQDDLESNRKFVREVIRRWPLFHPFIIKRDGWLGAILPGVTNIPKTPCSRWFELNITAQAKAVLCCMDGKGEYVLGDAATQPLLDIYNQPHLIERRLHIPDRYSVEPCQRCTY